MSRQVGRNDPCPCRSGQKYKRCCLPAKRLWGIDERGRALPIGVFSFSVPGRLAVVDRLEESGKLDALMDTPYWEDIHMHRAFSLLTPAERADVFLTMNMPSELVLFTERTGYLPTVAVWHYWMETGRWLLHPESSVRFRSAVLEGLEAVVHAYPHVRPKAGDLCEFEDAVVVHSNRFGTFELKPEDDPHFFVTAEDLT